MFINNNRWYNLTFFIYNSRYKQQVNNIHKILIFKGLLCEHLLKRCVLFYSFLIQKKKLIILLSLLTNYIHHHILKEIKTKLIKYVNSVH